MAISSAVSKGAAPVQRAKAAEDKSQSKEDEPQQREQVFGMAQLWDGTAFIAQTAVITFSLSLSGRVLSRPLNLFSWHPLSQIFGLVLLIQSILVLQPTHTAGQKRVGQAVHAYLNLGSFVALTAGFVAIYLNKERNNAAHFTTLHGALGCTLTLFLWGQYLVGFTMWATPALYGGEAKAKSFWKLHRIGGYVNFLLLLATFCTAADTGFVRKALKIESWVFYAPMALIAINTLSISHSFIAALPSAKRMPPYAPNVCTTPACWEIATALNASMHEEWRTLDPCQEWDKLVCDGYRSENVLAHEQFISSPMEELSSQVKRWVDDTLTSSFETICVKMSESNDFCNKNELSDQQFEDDRQNFNLVKKYYEACKESYSKEDGEDILKHFLSAIFGNYDKNSTRDAKTAIWASAVAIMFSMELPTFISVYERPDMPKMITVAPHLNFSLPDYTYYTGDVLKDYAKSIQNFFFHTVDWCLHDAKRASTFARHIVQIERELKSVVTDETFDAKTMGPAPVAMSVGELADLLPHLPIKAILQSQLPTDEDDSTLIAILELHRLEKIDAVVASVPYESLLAYQYWQAFRYTHTLWKTHWKQPWDNLMSEVDKIASHQERDFSVDSVANIEAATAANGGAVMRRACALYLQLHLGLFFRARENDQDSDK
ncbi:hypothetical protein PWT90_10231 [Aphanocladium album]|nr:hypothetical protein PWT90_10231 [Aphanocladium album]